MPRHPKTRKPKGAAGAALNAFLTTQGISLRKAAEDLRVTHVAVLNWIAGKSSPRADHRVAIEVWTRGDVPASLWVRSALAVRPYEAA